ncbi:Nn.00g028570.m01.CDS01 [Neocucurbitaria sp. VM-36]
MSGILCVWANLPKGTTEWYENEYVPNRCSQNAIHALHSEKISNGMEAEPNGKLDAPWDLLTVYEIPEIRIATDSCYDKSNHPSNDLLAGALKDARFDTRTYRELKRWQAEDWNGDIANIASVAVMEWRVSADVEKDVLQFYTTVVGPTISSSPDVLRFRLFEVDNATVLQGSSYVTKEKDALLTYFTLVELESEQWPWDAVVELAEIDQWKEYFEQQTVVKWQVSDFLVKKRYWGKSKAEDADANGKKGTD